MVSLNGFFGQVHGVTSLLALSVNTIFWCSLLFVVTFFKLVIPVAGWRRMISGLCDRMATCWIWGNNTWINLTKQVQWEVQGLSGLNPKGWYLVMSNHQSWLDIVVLQKVFYRKIPFLKFFLKKELIWVPFLGQAWWALDFPFMKRYSRSYLEKHPERKGQDLATTRQACAKFKKLPVTIMNFVEGTRFTAAKALKQGSPYRHLLKPKAAGVAFVLGAMGDYLTNILDVTISYPEVTKGLWAFMCGRVRKIKVVVETIPITSDLLGDYIRDLDFQRRFQTWINEIWGEKDKMLQTFQEKT
ncbi:MAG: acyltransferase [Deltaproteobacteria bacterium]|nr:acyltransferase [Deltaproteobacteria bacterium]